MHVEKKMHTVYNDPSCYGQDFRPADLTFCSANFSFVENLFGPNLTADATRWQLRLSLDAEEYL